MRRWVARLLMVASVAFVAVAPGVASAKGYPNTPKGAVKDCGAGHDPLVGHYTVKVLQQALRSLTTSSREYTTCDQALNNAIRALLAGHRPKPGSTGPTGPSTGVTGSTKPAKDPIKSKIANAVASGGKPRGVSGLTLTPGAITTRSTGFLNSIPTSILIVLAALLAAAAAFGGLALRNVVLKRRSH